MDSKITIPAEVKKQTRYFVKNNGARVLFLGTAKGLDAFALIFPDDMEVGFPKVYLCHGEKLKDVLYAADALDCIRSFRKED